jgi:hypothetical protein
VPLVAVAIDADPLLLLARVNLVITEAIASQPPRLALA